MAKTKEHPSDAEFLFLAALLVERTGREVVDLVTAPLGRRPSYGTAYSILSRLRRCGWISVTEDIDEDGRLKHFKVTGAGLAVLNRERLRHREYSRFGLSDKLGGAH